MATGISDLTKMASSIIKIIIAKYPNSGVDESIDITQIKNICNLYKAKSTAANSLTLSEIDIDSPAFNKNVSKKVKNKSGDNQTKMLKSPEFSKKYAFFIRVVYACLKVEAIIFDTNSTTLMNNHQLIKSLEAKKKSLILEHVDLLKALYKASSEKINNAYEPYVLDFMSKMSIIDKIISHINKLVMSGVLEKTDNLLSLLLPYFYTYTTYIEEYG